MELKIKSVIKRLLERCAIRARARPHRAFWGSGRTDISERLEDIIYGPAPDDITADN